MVVIEDLAARIKGKKCSKKITIRPDMAEMGKDHIVTEVLMLVIKCIINVIRTKIARGDPLLIHLITRIITIISQRTMVMKGEEDTSIMAAEEEAVDVDLVVMVILVEIITTVRVVEGSLETIIVVLIIGVTIIIISIANNLITVIRNIIIKETKSMKIAVARKIAVLLPSVRNTDDLRLYSN